METANHWDAGNRVTLGVLFELQLLMSKPAPFFQDSQSAENLAMYCLVYHKRSKHIEIKYHWVREHVDLNGKFMTARLTQTGGLTADIFTKAPTGEIYAQILDTPFYTSLGGLGSNSKQATHSIR